MHKNICQSLVVLSIENMPRVVYNRITNKASAVDKNRPAGNTGCEVITLKAMCLTRKPD